MGALLSLPLLAVPSISTIGSFALSCCGAATCSAICSSCGKCRNSMATRIAYALILLINSIISWLMLTDWAIKKLQHLTLDYFDFKCVGHDCYGFVAVHRINFGLGVFHALMAVMLVGVHSSRDGRAPIQNGFWGPKLLAWIGLIVVSFFIPDGFFVVWGNYFALIGAILFLLLGLILLVDLAHTWAEWCLLKIETSDSRIWRVLLIGSALSMYLGALAMTIVMYIFFAGSGCSMNQAAITINLLLLLGTSILSVHPMIQESNSRAGLAQSAMVAIYCTYLTMSAVGMEPDDMQCNPLVRARGTRKASIIVGAILTFLTVAYTTTRAATYGLALGGKGGSGAGAGAANGDYARLGTDDYEHGLVAQQPSSRREMRAAALRAAVESGSLPASALDESDSDEDDDGDGKAPRDDERASTQYNYSLFHVIFLLSTAWVATLLTMNFNGDEQEGGFVPVGRTYWASWAKILSAWACYGIYTWSLVAPVVLPDRFDY
ncbi:serine incorporator/TMS membrane protein [Lineolata rhizophorae]|uniref:Serine incorporator/TMS membrane protein n=1 Tax=Lineolata rhizophorae TaxID=578093 RepID=A0A6A6NXJ2_9PEZI|nr:serine incorporator/TMS membrane protein [Lineolata rhizophorae]